MIRPGGRTDSQVLEEMRSGRMMIPAQSTVIPIVHSTFPRSSSGLLRLPKESEEPQQSELVSSGLTTFAVSDTGCSNVAVGKPGGLRNVVAIPEKSGRTSADPLEAGRPPRAPTFSSTSSLNDLDRLDLRNLDPVVAQRMLDEIQKGADIKTTLEKFHLLDSTSAIPSKERMVTFEDET